MTRVNAALLAGAVSVLLFAAAIALVDWLMELPGLWTILDSNATVVFACVVALAISSLTVAIVMALRRRTKRNEDEPLTPLIRRSPSTGRREL
jgi:NADH:ubiquinone oxidoreductase subunit K